MRSSRVVPILLLLALLPVAALSQIPQTLSYQGVVTDSTGKPLPDGNYTFTFRLYASSGGGVPVWTEIKDIDVAQGLFTTQLGDVTPLAGAVTFNAPYWLGVKYAAAPELQPLVPLNSTPYSLYSVKAETALVSLSSPVDPATMPVGDYEAFNTHAITATVSAVWDTMVVTVPAAGWIQVNVTAGVLLSDPTGCPCVFRGYLVVRDVDVATSLVASTTLNTLNERQMLGLTGGVNLPAAGEYTIDFVLYRESGGGAGSGFGNGTTMWIPLAPAAMPAIRPIPPDDENAAPRHE